MPKFIRDDDVQGVIAKYAENAGPEIQQTLREITSAVERLPLRTMATGIPLWDFKNNFAPCETLWLRDTYDGRIVGKGWRRLRRYRNVTVTGCYPALSVEKDGSSVKSVLVCWGNHEEIEAAKART